MSHWKQREGGGLFAIWVIRTIALRLGRPVARCGPGRREGS